jgi:hypothetical protein
MSSQNDEVERLRRLRDRQISLRDPKAKDHAIQHKIAQRYKPKKLTLASVIEAIPGRWIGMFFGGLFGLIIAIAINVLVDFPAAWMEWIAYLLILVGVFLGRGLGAAMDWTDEDHDALVKRG